MKGFIVFAGMLTTTTVMLSSVEDVASYERVPEVPPKEVAVTVKEPEPVVLELITKREEEWAYKEQKVMNKFVEDIEMEELYGDHTVPRGKLAPYTVKGADDVNTRYIRKGEMYFRDLPNWIKNDLKYNHWHISVVKYQLEDNGYISIEDKTILLTENYDVGDNLYYKIGFYVDSKLGNPSSSNIFNAIFDLEGSTIKDSAQKYFAYAFQQYILDPEVMEVEYPLAHEYLSGLLNKK